MAGNLLKQIKAPLKAVHQSTIGTMRANRINRAYERHLAECRRVYREREGATDGNGVFFREKVIAVVPGRTDNLLSLPPDYGAIVERAAQSVDKAFSKPSNCFFLPKLKTKDLPQSTAELPEIQNQEVITMQLKEFQRLDGLEALCAAVMEEVERKVYQSYVLVDKAYIYRNPLSKQQAQISWLWHYDNHPTELIKIMIYLTDVDEDSGPFEYLRRADTHEPASVAPKPLCGDARLPDSLIEEYLERGYEAHKAVGPKGTVLVFDDNILHRANLGKKGHRDAVVFQIRPSLEKTRPFLSPQWTGGFQHVDFPADPKVRSVEAKLNMASG